MMLRPIPNGVDGRWSPVLALDTSPCSKWRLVLEFGRLVTTTEPLDDIFTDAIATP
jgi:hypothetical protein